MSNSLAIMRPELVREWSDKNLPLMPDKITHREWKSRNSHIVNLYSSDERSIIWL